MDTGKITIHGREYKTVALRVAEFRETHSIDDGWAILTTPAFDGDMIRVKAEIIAPAGLTVAVDWAEEKRGSSQINKTSALENCITSAIGRALAAAGYGGSEYASANEVENAIQQQRTIDVIPAEKCPFCGSNTWNIVAGRWECSECHATSPPLSPADAAPPPEATNQARFEMAVNELFNRGATAISVIGGFDDPFAEMGKRMDRTLRAHDASSVADLTVRAVQLKFYRDLADTVSGLEAKAEEVAEVGI